MTLTTVTPARQALSHLPLLFCIFPIRRAATSNTVVSSLEWCRPDPARCHGRKATLARVQMVVLDDVVDTWTPLLNQPPFLDVVDWDKDGYLDLIVGLASRVQLFNGSQGGTFVPSGINPFEDVQSGALAAVDWDRDSFLDLIVSTGNALKFYKGSLSTTLTEAIGDANPFQEFYVADSPCTAILCGGPMIEGLEVVDWDLDGYMDLLVGTRDGHIKFFKGSPDGTVAQASGNADPFQAIDTGVPCSPEAVDWDLDGNLDLAVGTKGGLQFFKGALDGSLTAIRKSADPFIDLEQSIFDRPQRPVIVDFDRDGHLDLILAVRLDAGLITGGGEVHVFRGSLNSTFVESTSVFDAIDCGEYGGIARFVDWDRDGHLDLVLGTYPWSLESELKLFQGDLDGSLTEKINDASPFQGVNYPPGKAFEVVDWDRDGFLDLILDSWQGVRFLRGAHDGHFTEAAGNANPFQSLAANFISVAAVDWDQDGYTDLLLGYNSGINFFQGAPDGSITEKTEQTPFRGVPAPAYTLAFVDWDQDGHLDLITEAAIYKGPNLTLFSGSALPSGLVRFAVVDWDRDGHLDILRLRSNTAKLLRKGFCDAVASPCSMHGFCAPLLGTCTCMAGYGRADCSGCAKGFYQVREDFNSLQPRRCRACPGKGDICDGRGLCHDDATSERDAWYAGYGSYWARRTGGTGNCTCSRFFSGTDQEGRATCHLGECPSGQEIRRNFKNQIFECHPCPLAYGKAERGNKDPCIPCNANDLSDGLCTPCNRTEGMVPNPARTSCQPCGAGKIPDVQQGSCVSCLDGEVPSLENSRCISCESGKFSANGVCQVCDPGKHAMRKSTACSPCGTGKVPTEGRGACEACEAGKYAADGISCQPCQPGKHARMGSATCVRCNVGEVPTPSGGTCETCPVGKYTADSIVCERCSAVLYTVSLDGNKCVVDWLALLFFGLCATAHVVAFFPSFLHLRRPIRLADVAHSGEGIVLTTLQAHGLTIRRQSAAKFHFAGTGCPQLDKTGFGFRARRLDAMRLEVLNLDGASIDDSMIEASMGTMLQQLPGELMNTGLICPCAMYLSLLPLPWIACASQWFSNMELLIGLSAVSGTVTAATFAGYLRIRGHFARSPLQLRIGQFKKKLLEQNPRPARCDPGPERAVRVSQISGFLIFFNDYLRQRTAYYLNANITKVLTKPYQMSFAEVAGNQRATFFVSHYWGTAFAHFVEAIQRHANSDIIEAGNGSLAYWICFFSNNQWRLSEEVGDWSQSSFYKALRGGSCRATCMVLDKDALPLTRSWCLFEVLQTFKLQNESDGEFEGLTFCTDAGVIGSDIDEPDGSTSYDVALALARRLSTLSVADAKASSAKDEEMIRNLVASEAGGMDAMNDFIRGNMSMVLAQAQQGFIQRVTTLQGSLSQRAPAATDPHDDQDFIESLHAHDDRDLIEPTVHQQRLEMSFHTEASWFRRGIVQFGSEYSI